MKILNVKAGPIVGEILEKLFQDVVNKKIPNNKKSLMKRLKEIKKETL